MNSRQLSLSDITTAPCLFRGYIDPEDRHCNNFGLAPRGYETIAEDTDNLDHWVAEVGWIDVRSVGARNVPVPKLPPYVPVIAKYSGPLFAVSKPAVVAVAIGEVISPRKLKVIDSLEKRFGIPSGTPVVLQSYAKDRLLEDIWPERHRVFGELAKLGFAGVTALNYSVWRSQPHAERLINIMRAQVTYKELQALGMPAIPHVYWCDDVGLRIWAEWFNTNEFANDVAMDLQTMRSTEDWDWIVSGLQLFVTLLDKPVHFVITGATTAERINTIREIIPSVTFMNGVAARLANAEHYMRADVDGEIRSRHSHQPKSHLFRETNDQYMRLSEGDDTLLSPQLLASANDFASFDKTGKVLRQLAQKNRIVTP